MKTQIPIFQLDDGNTAYPGRLAWLRNALPRGLALFLGGFALLNVLGEFRAAHFDANLWLIDLRFLPAAVARLLVLACSVALITFAIRPPRAGWRRRLTILGAGTLGLVALVNAAQFYLLLIRGNIASGIPVSMSLLIGGALALVVSATIRNRGSSSSPGRFFHVLAVALGCLFLFPMAQMVCFGKTDYRRPADAAVVLGARVYADGHPSDALADRVRTACQLYRDGLVRKLIFSGGPGDGVIPEAESMRRMATKLGVKPEDILIDPLGLNTQATVRNSESVFAQVHASRILVVSHFYHLPRIKLAYQREGLEVYTVPAKETCLLRQTPFNMAREVAALWVYYLRPLA